MKFKFPSLSLSSQDKKIYNMLFDVPLDESHPRYKMQQMLLSFATYFPRVKLETADFYNNGSIISFHFNNDAFIIVCDMDELTIETSILIDYEDARFEEIEEKIKFDWNELAIRLNILESLDDWQIVSNKQETIATYKTLLREQENEFIGNK